MAFYLSGIDYDMVLGSQKQTNNRSFYAICYLILIGNIRKDRLDYLMGIYYTRSRIFILLQDFKNNKTRVIKMGKLMEIIKKISGKEEEEYIPKVVVDKRLDGLRRLKQVQDNETEKEQLIIKIADFNRARTAKHLFGIKDKKELLEKKRNILSKIEENKINIMKEKKVNILKEKKSILSGSLLDNRKEEFKKKEVNILTNHSSFLK